MPPSVKCGPGEPDGAHPKAGLARRLAAAVAGEVLFDPFNRGRYATDASHYQVMPVGVVLPRGRADVEQALAMARDEGISVLARGAGTSQGGQTVNGRW